MGAVYYILPQPIACWSPKPDYLIEFLLSRRDLDILVPMW